MLYLIPCLLLTGALVLSMFSGSILSNYGGCAMLSVNGYVYEITEPLTVVGIGAGDFDLLRAFPQMTPCGKDLFTISYDRHSGSFFLEPGQNASLSLLRGGWFMNVPYAATLMSGDYIVTELSDLEIKISFKMEGEYELD